MKDLEQEVNRAQAMVKEESAETELEIEGGATLGDLQQSVLDWRRLRKTD
jgi:hypothetical protein